MKIKKFNESKSRQIEWLDGETFKLKVFTGKKIKTTKINDHNMIELENCYWLKSKEFSSSLDFDYHLMRIDNSFGQIAEKKFVSDKYELFLFQPVWSTATSRWDENLIGIFDKNGKIIFLFDTYDMSFTLADNLVILDVLGLGLPQGSTSFLVFDLEEKKYVTFPRKFLTANYIAREGERKLNQNED